MTDINEIYRKLQKIRKSKDLKIKHSPLLKESTKLRYYQTQGVIHMFMLKALILGDDCGLGKSLTTLVGYCNILAKDPELKLMIIAPTSALYQWQGEIEKFCQGLSSQIVESVDIKVGKRRLKSFDSRQYQFDLFSDNNKNVVIFNYNTMCSDFHVLKGLMEKYRFMVVFDEATAFKNGKTQTFKNAFELGKLATRKYALSATVIKNNLLECYHIFKVVMPGLLGGVTTFKKNYCVIERQQLWKGRGKRGKVINKIVGYKNIPHFKKTIDPFYLGRKKAEVAEDLPEINSKELFLQMTPQQQDLYDDALRGFLDLNKFNFEDIHAMMNEDGDDIKKIDKLTALIYCQQICNSPKTLGYEAPSVKEKELMRILDEELMGEKVVIYTRFKRAVKRLEDIVRVKLGVKTTSITGDVSSAQREVNKKNFNTSDDCNIMFINSAAKEAVNLQSSGYLIFFDLPFSYGDFLQIIGRIHRIGSPHEKIFLVYLLCKGTVDEKTYNILSSKKELFDDVLGDSAVGAIRQKMPDMVNDLFSSMLEDAKDLYLKKKTA